MAKKIQTLNSNLMETEYIHTKVGKCESVDELKEEILPILNSQKEQWSAKINEILIQNNKTQESFGKLCGVCRASVNKWCHGRIPDERDQFIKIGLAAGYDADEISRFIQRYGWQGLYSKNPKDLTCIFVINNYDKEERVEKYTEILKKVEQLVKNKPLSGVPEIQTQLFEEKLSDVKDEDVLESFIQENIKVFSTTYRRLYVFAKRYLDDNVLMGISIHQLSKAQNWSPSFTNCVYELNQSKWIPDRKKIISFGLHASMNIDNLNEMLENAYMEPLCAKNIFESVIIFILESADMDGLLDQKCDTFDPDGLINYAYSVMEQIDLPEITSFMSEITLLD